MYFLPCFSRIETVLSFPVHKLDKLSSVLLVTSNPVQFQYQNVYLFVLFVLELAEEENEEKTTGGARGDENKENKKKIFGFIRKLISTEPTSTEGKILLADVNDATKSDTDPRVVVEIAHLYTIPDIMWEVRRRIFKLFYLI